MTLQRVVSPSFYFDLATVFAILKSDERQSLCHTAKFSEQCGWLMAKCVPFTMQCDTEITSTNRPLLSAYS